MAGSLWRARAHRLGAKESPGPPVQVRFADSDEVARWDDLLLAAPDEGNAYRGSVNIACMALQGYQAVRLIVGGHAVTGFRVDVRPLGAMWMLIGPPASDAVELVDAACAIADFAAEHGVSAVRVRPQLREDEGAARFLRDSGLVRVPSWLSDHIAVVDLSGTQQQVYARFKKQTRHALRRSVREGVQVRRVEPTSENCVTMNRLVEQTRHERFSTPPDHVLTDIYRTLSADGAGQMFMAWHGGRVVAAAFAVVFGENAMCMVGGSVRKAPGDAEHPGLGTSGAGYALQWECMKWAHERGCTRYDMDVTPSTAHIHDPTHPFHRIGKFKKSFSREITDYLGCYQVSGRPLSGWMIRMAERFTQRIAARRARQRGRRPNPDFVWLR
ncbi:hypothetical protein GCM10023353_08170 [Tomitella cavernea]|uniref:BioF2-like acetyltransferase domain-containing protein n=2 Tax=Tomitella cavernea TaxID=1387982 RepID=A0ABP9C9S5_9ACTN